MSDSNCNVGQDLKSLRGKMPTEPLIVEGLCLEVECGVVLSCVTKTTTYAPKGKLSYTSETVYTDKDGAVIEGKEVACPLKVEVVTQPVEPPSPITLEGQDCAGDAKPATGLPGQIMQITQAPGQTLTVRICETDRDFELSCGKDPATGHQIQTAYTATASGPVILWRVDTVTGLPWTGDPTTLEDCGGTKLESDPIEMCDGGVEFIRWVVKKDGKPTGVTYDTDLSMQPYTVTDEANVTKGKCVPDVICEPTISSAPGNALGTLLPGTSVSVQKSNCCALKVTTSAGSFIVSKDVTGYSTGDFKCPVTVTAVEVLSGTCDLADVIVTTQFAG
jgi:hypothetical protein